MTIRRCFSGGWASCGCWVGRWTYARRKGRNRWLPCVLAGLYARRDRLRDGQCASGQGTRRGRARVARVAWCGRRVQGGMWRSPVASQPGTGGGGGGVAWPLRRARATHRHSSELHKLLHRLGGRGSPGLTAPCLPRPGPPSRRLARSPAAPLAATCAAAPVPARRSPAAAVGSAEAGLAHLLLLPGWAGRGCRWDAAAATRKLLWSLRCCCDAWDAAVGSEMLLCTRGCSCCH